MCSLQSSDLRRFGEWKGEQGHAGCQAIPPTGLLAVEKRPRSSRDVFGVCNAHDVPVGSLEESWMRRQNTGVLSLFIVVCCSFPIYIFNN